MNIITAIREEILVPIHPAGWPFIGAFAVVSAIITALWTPFWPFGLALTLWCVYFFRNPPRTIPQKPGRIIAPADGRVISVDEAEVPEEPGRSPRGAVKPHTFPQELLVRANCSKRNGMTYAVIKLWRP